MIHEYKCDECGKTIDVNISTYDIHKGNAIDLDRLAERINQARLCECGGSLKHKINSCEINFNFIYSQAYAEQQLKDIKAGR